MATKKPKLAVIDSRNQEYVKLGQIVVTNHPENFNLLGIGSCVGLYFYDTKNRRYMMSHCLLPSYDEMYKPKNLSGKNGINHAGKYVDQAIEKMIDRFRGLGSKIQDIQAKIVGGSQIYLDHFNIGQRNVEISQKMLKDKGIKVTGEDVGGRTGRSILAYYPDGSILIKKSGKKYKI